MDVVTLALAKQYTDSQRSAYTEKKVITWDGDTTGKINVPDEDDPAGITRWVIFEGSVDTLAITAVSVYAEDGEYSMTFRFPVSLNETVDGVRYFAGDKTYCAVSGIIGSHIFNGFIESEMDLWAFNMEDTKGIVATLYDNGNGQRAYISAIEFEIIHPIDPKFIPAMDAIPLNGADGKQYRLAVDESGTLAATAIE